MNWFRRRRAVAAVHDVTSLVAPAPVEQPPTPEPAPDQAWKLLSITNEWVRHADAKTGVTLAFAAATAATLLNVVDDHAWTRALTISAVLAGVALILTIAFAALALFPRVQGARDHSSADETVNLLFFGDIRRHYGKDRPSYRDVLAILTSDSHRLTEQLADQVHANAKIAVLKFHWVNLAIVAEIAAVVTTTIAAVVAAGGW